jgi:hypothetical protein
MLQLQQVAASVPGLLQTCPLCNHFTFATAASLHTCTAKRLFVDFIVLAAIIL